MCYVGVFFEVTQRVEVELMQIHMGLSRELNLFSTKTRSFFIKSVSFKL